MIAHVEQREEARHLEQEGRQDHVFEQVLPVRRLEEEDSVYARVEAGEVPGFGDSTPGDIR